MTLDEMIAVLQAAKAGKAIQCKHVTDRNWHDCKPATVWNFVGFDYRVKPEPRVIYCNVFQDGSMSASPSKEEAERIAELSSRIIRVAVRFIEDTSEQGSSGGTAQ